MPVTINPLGLPGILFILKSLHFTFANDALSLHDAGCPLLTLENDGLEIQTEQDTLKPVFKTGEEGMTAQTGPLGLRIQCRPVTERGGAFLQITLTLKNESDAPIKLNAKWRLLLPQEPASPRWLIPALLYKENVSQYVGLPTLVGEPDLRKSVSPWWLFRADLCALPMVMAWVKDASVAMVIQEHIADHLTSVGLDNRPGQRAILGSWPCREEPRPRECANPFRDVSKPALTFAELQPGQSVEIAFLVFGGDANPHSYAPVLREIFEQWDAPHPLNPWFSTLQAIDHAAHGLFTWHYDPEHSALWETCSYDRYYAKNDRYVDRFDMHTGFVSGIPYAHALRRYGIAHERADMAEAGRRVIDFCCRNLTPWGTFWSKFSLAEGWTTGWPAPQRAGGSANLGSGSAEIQARTIADATLFTARAAMEEPDAASRNLWQQAVQSNLDFILSIQRPDGNPGEAYSGADGSVLDWDGEAGIFWIAAFVEGWRLTGQEKYREAATRMGAYFEAAVEDAYLTGAPEGMHLLPTSEDPQNALISYTLLWEATGDQRWQRLALLSAELLMTFRWQYNTRFPAFTQLERYDYRTKGLDISSPNNVHLHPYGLVAIPELVRLWQATGDTYLLRQARNNLLGCHQMLASQDGVFDAPRGMMSERWHQSPNGVPKGGTLQLSHSWAMGLVLYADLWLHRHGQIFLDGLTGTLIALEAVDARQTATGSWVLENRWDTPLQLLLVIREAHGSLVCGDQSSQWNQELAQQPFTVPANGSIELTWKTE